MVTGGVSVRGGRSTVRGQSCFALLPFMPWRVAGHVHALHSCRHAPHRARARFFEALQVLHHIDGAFAGGFTLRDVPVKRLSQPWQVQLLPCESHGFAWEPYPLIINASVAAWGTVSIVVTWELGSGWPRHSLSVRWRVLLLVPSWMPVAQVQWCHARWHSLQVAVATLLVHLHPGHHRWRARPCMAGLLSVVKLALQCAQIHVP